MTPSERFWAKVDKSGECWEWTASRNPFGYGWFRYEGRMHLAHRALMLMTGHDLVGLEVDHICRNRGCVNPTHLRVATRKQNSEHRDYGRGPMRGVKREPGGTFRARVKHFGNYSHLGSFATAEEAAEAARLGRIERFTHNDDDRRTA